MPKIYNFEEANSALLQFMPNAKSRTNSYTTNHIKLLMRFLGDPQNTLSIVHVAGTSGKTSTSYYVAGLLRAAGKKVGLTVSPHVTAVNERLQINMIPLSEREFCQAFGDFLEIITGSPVLPSYFEFMVAFAYWEFARQKVDYAVIEVGLGGLNDATNVITRNNKVCIITDIGLDHTDILGNSLAQITFQKAGIIQPHNEVFCYDQGEEVIRVIEDRCRTTQAHLHLIENQSSELEPTFLPLFQRRNFGLAKETVTHILKRDNQVPLNEQQYLKAAKIHIPARMEIFAYGRKTIILDGSHNPQKLLALVTSIREQFPSQPIATLVSFAAGSEYRLAGAIKLVEALSAYIMVTAFSTEQDAPRGSVPPADVVKVFRQYGFISPEIIIDPGKAFRVLLKRPEPVLLVTGSFYLLNTIRPQMLELIH